MAKCITPLQVMVEVVQIQSAISRLNADIALSFEPLSAMTVAGHLLDASISLASVDPNHLIPLSYEQGKN